MFPDDEDALGRYEFLLTLSALVRSGVAYRPNPRGFVEQVVRQRAVFSNLAEWCGACAGLDEELFVARMDTYCREATARPQYFDPDSLNTALSLQSGGPVPPFLFIAHGNVDVQMMAWPCRQTVFNLVHALLRGRTRRLVEGGESAALPAFSKLEPLITALLDGRTECSFLPSQAALDFIFWGKDAEEHAMPAHERVVRELRTAMVT